MTLRDKSYLEVIRAYDCDSDEDARDQLRTLVALFPGAEFEVGRLGDTGRWKVAALRRIHVKVPWWRRIFR